MQNFTAPAQGSATPAHLLSANLSEKAFDPVGPPIAYDPAHGLIAGDPTSGLLLGQIVYWTSIMRARYGEKWDGWFYKTASEWERETTLTRSMQETARAKFARTGVVIFSNKGQVCGKLSFKLDTEVYSRLMGQIRGNAKPDSDSCQTAFAKEPKQIRKRAKAITENTQEITQRNTTTDVEAVASTDKSSVSTPSPDITSLLARLESEAGLNAAAATKLIKNHGIEKVTLQLNWLPDRNPDVPAKVLRAALRDNYGAPHRTQAPVPRPTSSPASPPPPRPKWVFVPQGNPRPTEAQRHEEARPPLLADDAEYEEWHDLGADYKSMGVELPDEAEEVALKPFRPQAVAAAKEAFATYKSVGAVRGMRQRLAPGYSTEEWETIVKEVTR